MFDETVASNNELLNLLLENLRYATERRSNATADVLYFDSPKMGKKLRSALIDNDVVEAVITLPRLIDGYNVDPGVIVIANDNKDDDRKGNVIFMDAQQQGEEVIDNGAVELLSHHVMNILALYEAVTSGDDHTQGSGIVSRVVTNKDVAENDYDFLALATVAK